MKAEKMKVLAALREINRMTGQSGVPGFFTVCAIVCEGDGDLFASCFYAFAREESARHYDHKLQLVAAIAALENEPPDSRA